MVLLRYLPVTHKPHKLFDLDEEAIVSFSGEFEFLSNFFPAEVTYLGDTYPTVEHAYQAAKFVDPEQRAAIRNAPTAGKAKRMAYKFGKDQVRQDWEAVKIPIMADLLFQKFSHSRLRQYLLDTHKRKLIEGNTWDDMFWGECPVGKGLNILGWLLMNLRYYFRKNGVVYG